MSEDNTSVRLTEYLLQKAAIEAEIARRTAERLAILDARQAAAQFMTAANHMESAIKTIERLGVNDELLAEPGAVNVVLKAGEGAIAALRRLAMRFDRGAYLNQP